MVTTSINLFYPGQKFASDNEFVTLYPQWYSISPQHSVNCCFARSPVCFDWKKSSTRVYKLMITISTDLIKSGEKFTSENELVKLCPQWQSIVQQHPGNCCLPPLCCFLLIKHHHACNITHFASIFKLSLLNQTFQVLVFIVCASCRYNAIELTMYPSSNSFIFVVPMMTR